MSPALSLLTLSVLALFLPMITLCIQRHTPLEQYHTKFSVKQASVAVPINAAIDYSIIQLNTSHFENNAVQYNPGDPLLTFDVMQNIDKHIQLAIVKDVSINIVGHVSQTAIPAQKIVCYVTMALVKSKQQQQQQQTVLEQLEHQSQNAHIPIYQFTSSFKSAPAFSQGTGDTISCDPIMCQSAMGPITCQSFQCMPVFPPIVTSESGTSARYNKLFDLVNRQSQYSLIVINNQCLVDGSVEQTIPFPIVYVSIDLVFTKYSKQFTVVL